MRVGLDTSVVVRLVTGQPPAQAAKAVALLDELRRSGHRAAVSDLVVAEAYFALQHHYGVPKADAIEALREMLEAGEVEPMGAAADVLSTPGLSTAKPGFVDRLIHAGYSTGGGRMATFERAAARLGQVLIVGSRAPRP